IVDAGAVAAAAFACLPFLGPHFARSRPQVPATACQTPRHPLRRIAAFAPASTAPTAGPRMPQPRLRAPMVQRRVARAGRDVQARTAPRPTRRAPRPTARPAWPIRRAPLIVVRIGARRVPSPRLIRPPRLDLGPVPGRGPSTDLARDVRPGWLISSGVRVRPDLCPLDPDFWRLSRLDLGEVPPDPVWPDPDLLRLDPDPRPRPDPARCRPDPDRVGVDPDPVREVLTDPELVGLVRVDPELVRPPEPDPPRVEDPPEGVQRPDRRDVGEVAIPLRRAVSRASR